tara:strand:+ start:893 stop:1021 length:129 start_codon:yes stop_codon:yes gene_type:complete
MKIIATNNFKYLKKNKIYDCAIKRRIKKKNFLFLNFRNKIYN